jgi:hypothetical protein
VEHIGEVHPTRAFRDCATCNAYNLHQRDGYEFAGGGNPVKDAVMGAAYRHADGDAVAFRTQVVECVLQSGEGGAKARQALAEPCTWQWGRVLGSDGAGSAGREMPPLPGYPPAPTALRDTDAPALCCLLRT